MPLRHPSEYRLVIEQGGNQTKFMTDKQLRKLRRLAPICPIPEGYEEVTTINGKSVYGYDGKLLPKYCALQRIRNGCT